MAVPEQTPYNIYTANGVTTVFPYEFYILQAGDLAVSIDGVAVTTGFTISGVGTVNGGEVTFLVAPAAGGTVMLERSIPAARTTDYQDNGDLLADTVNKDFDRIWMAIRQAFISLGIALTRPLFGGPFNAKGYRISDVGDPVNDQDAATKKWTQGQDYALRAKTLRVSDIDIPAFPNAALRANKVPAFDSAGNPTVMVPASGSAADVLIQLSSIDAGKGASLVNTESGKTVQQELDTLNKIVTLRSCGGVVDGLADDKLAFIAAIEKLKSIGGGQLIIGGTAYISAFDYDLSDSSDIEITGGKLIGPAISEKGGSPTARLLINGHESDTSVTFTEAVAAGVREFTGSNQFASGDVIQLSNFPTGIDDIYTQASTDAPRIYTSTSLVDAQRFHRRKELLQVLDAAATSFRTVEATAYTYNSTAELKAVKMLMLKGFKISCDAENIGFIFKYAAAPLVLGNFVNSSVIFNACHNPRFDGTMNSINSDCRVDAFGGTRAPWVRGTFSGMNGGGDNGVVKMLGVIDLNVDVVVTGTLSDASYTHGVMVDTEYAEDPDGYPSLPTIGGRINQVSRGIDGSSVFLTCDPFYSLVSGINVNVNDNNGTIHVKGAEKCILTGIIDSLILVGAHDIDMTGLVRNPANPNGYIGTIINPLDPVDIRYSDFLYGWWLGFEPTIHGAGNDGTVTYLERKGMYLRRGDEVHFHMHILWSSASGFGGTMQVSLPPVSAMSDFPQSVTIGEQSGFPAGVVLTSATVTAAQMLTITNRGAAVDVPTSGYITVSGIYRAFA
ncbi:hypothetical protein H2Y56_05890 [Pectobacterium aroidearum]|uniref:Uncharacterized protein n=1 Tax=Pectobacterium aroidearum TaxID=1201031 RepID=A0ABR5ZAR5_9GAMM|nr:MULTISPECIES: phage tail fiber protein [Pectobacterium]MBA5198857.1 hypothetical protein [Pectobacterium aroidearum]MBA5231649.1 hypothetical protein [Pectobacterium aroidearum]MBA5736827.1 hypothetical protein [Pectobacterium aroidearum]UXJ98886.1 phage tail fiber protein [Pectobacterium aroidearum]GKV93519.1 hypothetical protein PEC301645_09660 [Pectobacterium carotovorum subsp. carotovorum]